MQSAIDQMQLVVHGHCVVQDSGFLYEGLESYNFADSLISSNSFFVDSTQKTMLSVNKNSFLSFFPTLMDLFLSLHCLKLPGQCGGGVVKVNILAMGFLQNNDF